MLKLYTAESEMLVWWATELECVSAICRRERDAAVHAGHASSAFGRLKRLSEAWHEVQAGDRLKLLRGGCSERTTYAPPTRCSWRRRLPFHRAMPRALRFLPLTTGCVWLRREKGCIWSLSRRRKKKGAQTGFYRVVKITSHVLVCRYDRYY
jgi:hypothetical protein